MNIPDDAAVGEIVSCADCGADFEIAQKRKVPTIEPKRS